MLDLLISIGLAILPVAVAFGLMYLVARILGAEVELF